MLFRSEDETFKLAGKVVQNLIASYRKTCKALRIKGSKDCKASELVKCMNDVPAFILDKQESSARGAARTALALVYARNPDIDLELCTAGVPLPKFIEN